VVRLPGAVAVGRVVVAGRAAAAVVVGALAEEVLGAEGLVASGSLC